MNQKPSTRFRLLGACAVGALLQASPGHAQTPAAPGALSEVVVTGSRIQASGFTAPTPVIALGAERLEQRATDNAGELLNELPQFRITNGPTQGQSRVMATAAAELLDLRGLGPERTLVLIDGRRHVPTTVTGSTDLNVVPVSLLDRMEVVTGGASAAYGSDAVAGVVNIILKDRLQGVQGIVQTGVSNYGDNKSHLVGFGAGTDFAGGRGHLIVGGDYASNDDTVNKYARDWGRLESYGPITLTATRPAGVPANLFADHAHYVYPTDGVIISGPLRGLAFAPGGGVRQFEYGSLVGGTHMVGGEGYGEAPHGPKPLRVGYDRASFMGRLNFDVTERAKVFAEFGYAKIDTFPRTTPSQLAGLTILRDNAFLPASVRQAMVANNLQTISVSRNGFDFGEWNADNEIEVRRAVFGASGQISEAWSWDAYYQAGRTQSTYALSNNLKIANFNAALYAVAGPNGPVCGPTATNPFFNAQSAVVRARLLATLDANCVPINIFGRGSPSAEALAYVQGTSVGKQELNQQVAAVNLQGRLFDLGAGPVQTAMGLEWRKDEASGSSDARSLLDGWNAANPRPVIGESIVKEAYLEASAPLLGNRPLIKRLDINGAVRRTDYSTSGAVTTWKVGFNYEPVESLRLRATRSRDIRAPNLNDLFNVGTTNTSPSVINPITGGGGVITVTNAGNPNLKAEVADTTTAGFVVSPTWNWLSGFRASVDYYSIDLKGGITTLPAQEIINRYYLSGRTDLASFITFSNAVGTGFSQVVSVPYNVATIKTNGVDIELQYRAPLDKLDLPGRLDIRAVGSWVDDLRTVDPGNRTDIDAAGQAVPDWQWNVNLTYVLNRLTTSATVRAFTGVKFSTTLLGPDDPNYNPASANSINKNRFPARAYLNLNVQYDLGRPGGVGLKLFGVVDNVLNTDPPMGASSIQVGSPYDVMGRYFKAGFRFSY